MVSRFSWVDFSESDKNKMHEIIRSLSDPNTRDELGIASIRDSFANMMFPGTTTIQTRVKYMLFVPWIYKIVEEEKLIDQTAAERIKELEIKLIKSLKENNNDENGIIGQRAGANISRTPADIYWAGLRHWEILKVDFSRRDFHALLKIYYKSSAEDLYLENDYQIEDIPIYKDKIQLWDPGLLKRPKHFPVKANLNLTYQEAYYLKEKIKKSCSKTVLSEIIDLDYQNVKFVWEHNYINHLNSKLYNQIQHAHNFADTIFGAHILYNLMLTQEDKNTNKKLETKYFNMINEWKNDIKNKKSYLENWDLNNFWYTANIYDIKLKSFVNSWYKMILNNKFLNQIESNSDARKLIIDREKLVKGKRARLLNKKYLEKWGGSSSTSKLDFRWNITNSFIKDINFALKGVG